jgi:hypothetical protein
MLVGAMSPAESTAALIRRIWEVSQRARIGDARESTAEVEAVLADGYAGVFALEAERSRVERAITEAFASSSNTRTVAGELRSLNKRMFQLDHEITRLRGLLEELRELGETPARAAG